MRTARYTALTAAIAAAAVATPAVAGVTGFATTVEAFNQGLKKNGGAVDGDRSHASSALFAPQLTNNVNFVSLGMGGSITLSFDNLFTDHVTVWETTYNNPAGHYETADLWVGYGSTAESASWWLVGEIENTDDGLPMSLDDVSLTAGRETFSYVRIVDTTPGNSSSYDGFDLDGVSTNLVPSPGPVALAALGGFAMTTRRRR